MFIYDVLYPFLLFLSPELAEYDCTVGRPNIKRWLDNVRKETQPAYDEAHAILWRVVEVGKAKRGGGAKL